MNLFELSSKLILDDDDFLKGIENSKKHTESLSAKTVAVGMVMAEAFIGAIKKVGEYGAKIVEVGIQQETSLAKVNTIMDTTVMNTEEMAGAIKDLSNEMGVSVSELSDTVYNAISATGDTANAVELAAQASKLATAGFTDTGSALGVLTTAMNSYGLSAEEAEHISDSLITVQNLGVTTVAELSSSMGKAIASAAAYGVNLENLESAYISITKAGINTAEGTTYLSSMMKELGDDGSKVSGILQEVSGKSFNELMNEGASLADVLEILNESVDGDSTALMNLWSSAEAGKASSALVGQGLEAFNDNLAQLQNTSGETEKAFDVMADTLEHKVGIFKNLGTNLASGLFVGMSGKLGGVVDFATGLLEDMTSAFEEGGIERLAYSFTESLFLGLSEAISSAGEVMTFVGGIIESIGAAIMEYSDTLLGDGLRMVEDMIMGMVGAIPNVIDFVVSLISNMIDTLVLHIPELIPMGLQMILSVVDGLLNNVDKMVDGAIAMLTAIAEGLVNAMPIIIEKAPEIIGKLVVALIENVPRLIEAAIAAIGALITGLDENIRPLLEKGADLIKQLGNKIKDKAKEFIAIGKNIVEGLWNGIKERWSKLKENVSGLVNGLVGSIKNLLGIHSPSKVFYSIGSFCADGFNNAMGNILSPSDVFGDYTTYNAGSIGGLNPVPASTSNTEVVVRLEGDAKALFKMMRDENRVYRKSTGSSAFA